MDANSATSRPLPPNWEVRHSRSRDRPYYYNSVTRESLWEFPSADGDASKAEENAGKVRARHILVKWSGSRRPSSWKEQNITRSRDEALAQIDSILSQLKSKTVSFADLAQKESDCGSAKAGGDLGFFGRGQMQAPFEQAVYGLQVGELSGPVWTDSGVHIIERTA